jgi:hypothetical protein
MHNSAMLRRRQVLAHEMYKNIQEHLIKLTQDSGRHNMRSLILTNVALLEGVTPTFYRNGTMYETGNIDRRAKLANGEPYTKLNRVLHPSLVAAYDDICAEHDRLKGYHKVALHYIAQILVKARTTLDVLSLVPSKYTRDITTACDAVYNIGSRMTSVELEAFKKDHPDGECAFIKLKLLEIITS